jgi:hypothetical protein
MSARFAHYRAFSGARGAHQPKMALYPQEPSDDQLALTGSVVDTSFPWGTVILGGIAFVGIIAVLLWPGPERMS